MDTVVTNNRLLSGQLVNRRTRGKSGLAGGGGAWGGWTSGGEWKTCVCVDVTLCVCVCVMGICVRVCL